MNRLYFITYLILLVSACEPGNPSSSPATDLSKYPLDFQKILAKHGGLDIWQKMNSLSYEIVKEEGNEKQMIHLKDRRERIEATNFTTGFDGKDFWVEADTSYKGNPVFYHNLMFYFYAMPFVLADDGIVYSETESLIFEEKTYPGIKISYNSGVGVSPEDEYFIYYDPTTFEMAWLAYTVTYFSKEKTEKLGWIRYNDWKTFNGLLLPNSLTWYKVEENKPIEPRNTRTFDSVTISETELEDAVFEKTEGAKIVDNTPFE